MSERFMLFNIEINMEFVNKVIREKRKIAILYSMYYDSIELIIEV